jgi:hypothetical protein
MINIIVSNKSKINKVNEPKSLLNIAIRNKILPQVTKNPSRNRQHPPLPNQHSLLLSQHNPHESL